ncbi:carbohydrate-binding protein [Pseudoalteromonas rubra]|uniref:Sugar-binding protein n=1 Tax=Pseudoalteromonas rubra TaxID=43658 RepID=A0A5S3X0Q5_9GAMM|nr:carbohydrate-binding protein [Pseudoalteromonas rubra]TMP37779.1 sugar-binding protein [Pseudoalteromonas rubra]
MKLKMTGCAAAVILSCSASAGTGVQDFLDSLRNFESGINPALADFYLENLNNPVYKYAKVSAPGRMVRDCSTGSMIPEDTTINQFFTKLGIDGIYNSQTPYSAEMFKTMQYNSMNAWGFVGYQLGEAVLIDAGYYSPKVVTIDGKEYDSFYVFVEDSTWIGCKTEALVEIVGSGGNQIQATDVNRWEGTFVGKNGVNSFADLLIPDNQELVMRDAMRFNYGVMTQLLTDANMTWEQALAKSWPGTDDNGNPITVQATMSGLLAAAHLRGAWGTARLLTKDEITCDELGTCITKYVHKFGGYNTIFDTPADDVIEGSKYDEKLSAGWGNDLVLPGGGVDVIELHEQSGSVTTVRDFTVGEDRIILRDWQTVAPLSNLSVSDVAAGAELVFAGQRVVLEGVSAAAVNVNTEAVIAQSDIYEIAWSGKQTVTGFNPQLDKIRGTAGIGFKHLKAYETDTALVIGVQAKDGGIYSSVELVGLTIADLTPDMFDNVTGGYDRLGFIVPLNSQNWGWNMALTVNSFDPAKTVISMPLFNYSFSMLILTQEGADTVITLDETASKGDQKRLVLKNTDVNSLSAANFDFVSGNFTDATIDVPVFYDITATVVGTGGSISPAPDANGVISGKGNTDFTLTFVPDSGYRVATLKVDGVSVTAQSSYTFVALAAAHSVQVTFEPGNACPAPWNAADVYTTGDQVTFEGKTYEAKWWTQGNNPASLGPWKEIANCQ